MMLLSGKRVSLRKLAASDRSEFLRMARSSQELHHPWVAPPIDAKAFGALLRRTKSDRFASLLVCERETEAIAGLFNVSEIVRGGFCSAYLGYYVHAAYAGRGYMTEGMTLVCRYAFTQLGLHRLEANIQPANVRSLRLAVRCGFRKEGFSPRYLKIAGRWRDHERWAITRDDP
jgi:ribosomal-protein-alanine N-acetyltransferase